MAETPTITELDILADVMAADEGDMTSEVARSVLNWKFSSRIISRMNELADRNNEGTIAAWERQELEKYLRVGSLINIIQAKARLSLKSAHSSES
jgi:hypothetical protein